ncbi:MAG: hypothetical protein WD052_12785 [Bacteroidales bacterium]
MEIKHTIEILTKDIQDIEKLVRNLNNYPTPPQIELDLAMSKLRHVYDLLLMISKDSKEERESKLGEGKSTQEKVAELKNQEDFHNVTGGNGQSLEQNTGTDPSVSEDERSTPPAEQKDPATEKVDQSADSAAPAGETEHPKLSGEEKAPESGSNDPAREKKSEEIKKSSILAEKFAADRSINEKISSGSARDMSSRLKEEPIDSIKRNIGINDRFLIIRELMDGDNERFNQLVVKLDSCTNFNEAYQLIETTFPGKTDHEGITILVRLARRRFMSRDV